MKSNVWCECGCQGLVEQHPGRGRPRKYLPGHRSPAYVLAAPRPCACGCGEQVEGRRKFAEGHRTNSISLAIWKARRPEQHALKRRRDRDRERTRKRALSAARKRARNAARGWTTWLRVNGVLPEDERQRLATRLRVIWKRVTSWCEWALCPPVVAYTVSPDPTVEERWFVYGLIDPRTRMIRYVGLTTRGVKRAQEHRSTPTWARKYHSARWVAELHGLGTTYEITILETVTEGDIKALYAAERWWIAYGRACGWDLTNLTDGGEGTPGHVKSDEERERMSVRSASLWKNNAYRERVLAKWPFTSLRARDHAIHLWTQPEHRERQVARLRRDGQRARDRHGSPMKDPAVRDVVALSRRLVAAGIRGHARDKRVFRRKLWNALFGVADKHWNEI